MEPFIGQIIMFGGNFAPRAWALCNGQLLSIAQNTALFYPHGEKCGLSTNDSNLKPLLRGNCSLKRTCLEISDF